MTWVSFYYAHSFFKHKAMKLKTIGVNHPFHVTQYLIPKVYIDAELEEGDNEEACKRMLFAKCLEMESDYKKFMEAPVAGMFSSIGLQALSPSEGSARGGSVSEAQPVSIGDVVRLCTTVNELELYFKVIDKKPEGDEKKELWKIYDEQYDKLQKQPA